MNPLVEDPAVDLLSYDRAVLLCDADKAALRAWRDEMRSGS